MDDCVKLLGLFSNVAISSDSNGVLCNCLVGALPCTHYVIPDNLPLYGVKVLRVGHFFTRHCVADVQYTPYIQRCIEPT